MGRSILLPPLAFGQQNSKIAYSCEELASQIAQLRGWEAEYKPIGPTESFVTQAAMLDINGLKITAISHSPMTTNVVAHDSSMLVFTTAGNGYPSLINGHPVNFEQGESAAYVTEGRRVGRGEYRSVLMIDINKQRLHHTVSSMHGEQDALSKALALDSPCELSMRVHNSNMNAGLAHLCNLLNNYCASPRLLELMAVDESCYRLIAMLFQPETLIGTETPMERRSVTQNRLEAACQYAIANMGDVITLTDLERISKLSARALQYGFLKKFGCSPMQWLRGQRLHLAHRRLMAALPGDSVTSIALSCGMTHLGQFSVDYRKEFGVSPSETLARVNQR